MELLCPLCMMSLSPAGGGRASCPKHGDIFTVLYQQHAAVATSADPQPQPTRPAPEPVMAASTDSVKAKCPACGRTYAVRTEQVGRSARCKCGQTFTLTPEAESEADAYELAAPPDLPLAASAPLSRPGIGVPCQRHPEMVAIARCSQCGAAVCMTCDFAYPGNIHLCPACATQATRPLSSKRKKLAIWSIVLAVVATLGTVAVFSGALAGAAQTPEDQEAIGLVIMLFCVIPSLVGLGVGLGSRDKRMGNPAVTWIGWIWNAVLVALWLFLIIIGNLMR
jgi:hypothetical protein